ncbi:Cyclin-I [Taenia solium]|eukprot:TsM_000166800 transcript=TsM_000166800 gene=TsM_000166800
MYDFQGVRKWSLNNQYCYSCEDESMPCVISPLCNSNFPPLCPQESSLSAFVNSASAHLLPLEHQFFSNISPLFGVDSLSEDKVDASMRDESLTRLLSLHRAYYDLSPVVFCKAVYLVDTFITRVKVKPKYMMCVATACYYIASKFETGKPRPTVDSLVRLTRCGGSVADLVRMVDIILTKLGASTVTAVGATSATALDFLSAFLTDAGLKCVGLPTFLVRQVENALCATNLALFRPSCLALALLLSYKQNLPPVCVIDSEFSAFKSLQDIDLRDLFTIANLGKVNWADVEACSRTLFENGTLESYSPSRSSVSAAEVVWNLSRRTRLNLSGSAPPSLKTISEWTEEEED